MSVELGAIVAIVTHGGIKIGVVSEKNERLENGETIQKQKVSINDGLDNPTEVEAKEEDIQTMRSYDSSDFFIFFKNNAGFQWAEQLSKKLTERPATPAPATALPKVDENVPF